MSDDRPIILVVEDNAANLKLMSYLLVTNGYAVRSATNADQALTSVREVVPALILMDLQLPGMDGLTLTRKLKADARTRGTFIVAITAYAMKGDEQRALEAGCDAYIAKPINTRSLPARIEDYLARAKTYREDSER